MKLVDYDPENDVEEDNEENSKSNDSGCKNQSSTNNSNNNNEKKNQTAQKVQQRPFWAVTPESYTSPIAPVAGNVGSEKSKNHDDILSELGVSNKRK